MKKIIINSKTHGIKNILVDDNDFEIVNKYKWTLICQPHSFYVVRMSSRKEGKRYFIHLHRFLMGLDRSDKRIIDHINHNGLDNRRCNLRVATTAQNNKNISRHKDSFSKYLGVNLYKGNLRKDGTMPESKWRAQLYSNGKAYQVYCTSEINAAQAYNILAEKHHGEFANYNKS